VKRSVSRMPCAPSGSNRRGRGRRRRRYIGLFNNSLLYSLVSFF
jgi:hypothetical protein